MINIWPGGSWYALYLRSLLFFALVKVCLSLFQDNEIVRLLINNKQRSIQRKE